MEQENPISESGDVSTLDRLESFLTAEEAPQQASENPPEDDKADAQDETQETDTGDESEQPGNTYQLSDIAKLLGAEESMLDVDDDGNVLVKTKVDGQEGKAKFQDLLKSYQLQSHVDKQVREAAEVRKAAQEQAKTVQQQVAVQQQLIGQLAEAKAIELELQKYQGIDWNTLIDQDPVQGMKLDRQFRDLQAKYQTKAQEINQAHAYIQQQQSQQHDASLTEQRQALLKALPDWSDDVKATKEKSLIQADLKARGYSDADIKSLSDHKAVLLARDAMLYRQLQAGKTVTEKQVKSAPRIAKPGSTASPNQSKLQTLHQAVRKTGSKQSVMDYLLATGRA